jgi:predicted DCC family thiol-disulfide oxidoreductase YuxK
MSEPYSYRRDSNVPAFADDKPVIVFDGHCAFCSAWANFVLRHDRAAHFRLLAAQSTLGRALYVHYGLNADDYETNLLIADGVAWFKSEACIKMGEGLGFPWSLAAVFRILPLKVRDFLYEFVARNRMKIAGRRPMCYMPAANYQDRFLG